MNQPNQPKKTGRNWSGAATIVGLTVVLGILMFAAFNLFFSGGGFSLPALNLQLGWIGILFAGFAVIFLGTGFIGFLVAKAYQWKVILWMATRLYQTKRQSKRKVRGKRMASFSQRLNPMTAKTAMPEESKVPFGSLKFDAGEKFLGPLFFPSWEVYTLWSFGWSTLAYSLVMAVIAAIIVDVWPFSAWLTPLIFLVWFVLQVLRYWGKEWTRMTRFFFVTSGRYGQGEGQWSTLRFLFRHGFDAQVEDVRISNIVKSTTDPVPKKWGIKIGRLLEIYIEGLADSDQRVGSVFIEGVAGKGTVLLAHYQYAPWINVLLQQAPKLAAATTTNLQRMDNVAATHELGKPGQRNDYSQLKLEAEAWKGQHAMRLGITQPQVVDLWALYLKYIEQLANPTNTPATPTPNATSASVPVRLPGQPVSRPQPPEEDEEPQAPPDPVV